MYLTVKSTTDANILQNDLHALEQWEQDWSMEFNSDKYEVLRIARKRNAVIFPYKLHKKELNVTNAAKYLGVTTSKDLNWTPHINNITGKAKNTLRFVKRNNIIINRMLFADDIYYIKLQFSLSVCLYPPFFSTRPSDRNQIWHTYSGRYGTHSELKKITHPTPEGSHFLKPGGGGVGWKF